MTRRTVYCSTCEREVVLRKKNFDHKYHELVMIFTICTIGLGYLLLRAFKKRNRCPHCETEFDIKNLSQYKSPTEKY